MADKHNAVTAASMKRRAGRHRELRDEHKLEARASSDANVIAAHTGAAMANHDAAVVLRQEAKEVLSHGKNRKREEG